MNRFRFIVIFLLLHFCVEVCAADKKLDAKEKGYTINFDNVQIREFLRFVSKIAGVNIIYDDRELNFNVTIISEEQASVEDIMSALVQVLRIHGLSLIEENQNLIIHSNPAVRQIPVVVSEENPMLRDRPPVIMTKVFQIRRGNPATIAALITPMLSKDAMVEVSMENRQLIVTDIAGSVDTIGKLLMSLDAPETPYDIDAFVPKNIPVADLEKIAKQLIKPLAESTLLEFVSYPEIGKLFIVSTPFLLEKTHAILEDLDQKPLTFEQQHILSTDNILIYHLKVKSPTEVENNLLKIAEEAERQGFFSPGLIESIKSMKFIKPTNSLLFVGSGENLKIIKTFLDSADISSLGGEDTNTKLFLFESDKLDLAELQTILNEIVNDLKEAEYPHPAFLNSLETAQPISAINSLLFIGNADVLKEIQALLAAIEQSTDLPFSSAEHIPLSTDFLLYSPQFVSAVSLKEALIETAKQLKVADLTDPAFIRSLEKSHVIGSANQLIFTGSKSSIDRIKTVLQELDKPALQTAMNEGPYFIQLKTSDFSKIKNAVDKLTEELPKADPTNQMVRNMKWLPDSNVLVLRGPEESLRKVKEVIDLTDSERGMTVVFINLTHANPDEILAILHGTAEKLSKTPDAPDSLIEALKETSVAPQTNTIIVTGSAEDIAKVRELIAANDSPTTGGSEIFVYKTRFVSPQDIQAALMSIAEHSQSHIANDPLVKAIESMKSVPDTNVVQFIGTPQTINKIKELLLVIDTQDHAKGVRATGSDVLVYKVQQQKAEDLLAQLKQIASDAAKTAHDEKIIKIIMAGRYVPSSYALVFTGPRPELDRIELLLKQLDANGISPKITPDRAPEGYKIYKPEFVAGNDLIQIVKHFEELLVSTGVTDPALSEAIDHLTFIPRTNTIIVTGSAGAIDRTMGLLKEFDTPGAAGKMPSPQETSIETIDETGFLIYKLQHQTGFGIVQALQAISRDLGQLPDKKKNQPLIDSIRSVQYIEIINSLLATGEPKVLTKLKELLESLDRPLKQVLIEILVLESKVGHETDFGLRWNSHGAVHNRFAWGTGNFSRTDGALKFTENINQISGQRIPSGSDIPPMGGGFLGVIGDVIWHKGKSFASLGSLLNAIKVDDTSVVILSQKIVVQDNQNARIFSGDNIPFTGSIVTTSGISQINNANLEYRNVGVTLSITPLIGDNDVITLDIDEEISEEVVDSDAGVSAATAALNGIRTSKTSMQTKAHLPNRHFLLLSGTMRNQVVRSVSGIPCLGGLPLIGAAFSEVRKLSETRDVIIFVKPHILKTTCIYDGVTLEQEELFGSPEQTNVEDWHRGIELIRSPNDLISEEVYSP